MKVSVKIAPHAGGWEARFYVDEDTRHRVVELVNEAKRLLGDSAWLLPEVGLDTRIMDVESVMWSMFEATGVIATLHVQEGGEAGLRRAVELVEAALRDAGVDEYEILVFDHGNRLRERILPGGVRLVPAGEVFHLEPRGTGRVVLHALKGLKPYKAFWVLDADIEQVLQAMKHCGRLEAERFTVSRYCPGGGEEPGCPMTRIEVETEPAKAPEVLRLINCVEERLAGGRDG